MPRSQPSDRLRDKRIMAMVDAINDVLRDSPMGDKLAALSAAAVVLVAAEYSKEARREPWIALDMLHYMAVDGLANYQRLSEDNAVRKVAPLVFKAYPGEP